ncbi:hypothetical protein CcrSwift_gp307 [Caulobacter phage CcrSwift]|uniref:Uncharacterized protein n=6 Tax=Viruses TaxID=10239 RepID=J3SMJ6_9CAUD|nr:hypothetical protein D865_gp118 [Caulobacter phage phiCbK]YP_006990040.1 hypothetical protein D870_gp114 [Caulobacter phage CcrSwift]ARB13836.1 hypothetical protein Ccr10_gp306 [Caulobacter phage Ccr10]ARB14181.1 hypothetical protein Ccr2_gp305 [Caulobacter phage Ccr2]ARB14875.1 hypothetical protein Ccr29_gp319 [Caulobacter phage Ccr29]ARB15213.1 hypothetical protein Ccr32_gp295 [Caulobacter phage Ccr32]ARB15547.1 hypothetical protein Ccr34_gp305 [Caulobacter phage Ccr34]
MVSAYQQSLNAQASGLSTQADPLARGYWKNGQWVRNSLHDRLKAYIARVPDVEFHRYSTRPAGSITVAGISPNAYVPVTDQRSPPAPFSKDRWCYMPKTMRALVEAGVLMVASLDVQMDGSTKVAIYKPVR